MGFGGFKKLSSGGGKFTGLGAFMKAKKARPVVKSNSVGAIAQAAPAQNTVAPVVNNTPAVGTSQVDTSGQVAQAEPIAQTPSVTTPAASTSNVATPVTTTAIKPGFSSFLANKNNGMPARPGLKFKRKFRPWTTGGPKY
jgi:hypothetical protein